MAQYEIKSEIDHILDRSGMYMGSINNELRDGMLFQPSTGKIIPVKNIPHNDGLQKLFDEILSNSVDEHRRSDSLFNITEINVSVSTDGTICIEDNGGIPVKKHNTGILIPELIFGHLRTSSNYDDTQDRNVIGTNGLGAKLTNIFSTQFTVETCDGKHYVKIDWTNNMRELKMSKIHNTIKHFTKITFKIDLKRFDMESLGLGLIRLLQKRCIDSCACNPKLRITFVSNVAEGKLNGSWNMEHFADYINLYMEPEQMKSTVAYKGQRFAVALVPYSLGYNIGFVNGAMCSEGTHVKIIQKQIIDAVINYCKKNEMELITEKDIINRMTLFINASIRNPTYDSQTKERLTNKLTTFDLKLSADYIKQILNSELIQALKDFYSVKYAEQQKKELRKLNSVLKNTKKSDKLIACSSSSRNKELWIFEGNSASNGFRKYRNPLTQSAYLLRGKIRNTFDLKRGQILENRELREICGILGLQFNEPQKNIKNLTFDKIIIASDADYDGSHICALALAFFVQHFKELITNHKVYRAMSPIIIAQNIRNSSDRKYYYTLEEYKADEPNIDFKKYEVRYTKGLGGLDNEDYRTLLRNQKLVLFNLENVDDYNFIRIWFEKSAIERKKLLLAGEGDGVYESTNN